MIKYTESFNKQKLCKGNLKHIKFQNCAFTSSVYLFLNIAIFLIDLWETKK